MNGKRLRETCEAGVVSTQRKRSMLHLGGTGSGSLTRADTGLDEVHEECLNKGLDEGPNETRSLMRGPNKGPDEGSQRGPRRGGPLRRSGLARHCSHPLRGSLLHLDHNCQEEIHPPPPVLS